MKIKVELKSVSDSHVETSETTLEKFLADDDGIGDEEGAHIRQQLLSTGTARVAGFVGVFADLTRID